MAYHVESGVDATIVRLFNTYGPRMDLHDGRVVPTFFRQALRREPLSIFGDGRQTRSLCYVSDLVRGLLAVAADGNSGGEVLNIGNPEEVTMLQLAELINNLTSNPAGICFEPLPVDDPTRRCPDISRITTRLGWQPQVPLRDGLRMTAPYFERVVGMKELGRA
jgi:nucleoside-diphosphate-sugar epimerase